MLCPTAIHSQPRPSKAEEASGRRARSGVSLSSGQGTPGPQPHTNSATCFRGDHILHRHIHGCTCAHTHTHSLLGPFLSLFETHPVDAVPPWCTQTPSMPRVTPPACFLCLRSPFLCPPTSSQSPADLSRGGKGPQQHAYPTSLSHPSLPPHPGQAAAQPRRQLPQPSGGARLGHRAKR